MATICDLAGCGQVAIERFGDADLCVDHYPGDAVINKHDPISNPSYYHILSREEAEAILEKRGGIEALDIMMACAGDNPLIFSALKYLLRAGRKQGNTAVQEVKKARQYLNEYLDREEAA